MTSRTPPFHFGFPLPPLAPPHPPLPPAPPPQPQQPIQQQNGGVWSEDEHTRFLEAMQFFPDGPWKDIAEFVATRSVRQVQTHAQKYHEKVARRLRGLRKDRKKQLVRQEHRIDDDDLALVQRMTHRRCCFCSDSNVNSYAYNNMEQINGPNVAPSATLWGSSSSSGNSEYKERASTDGLYDQCRCHQQQQQQLPSQYRDYDYMAYIEEEFAFRDADDDHVRGATSATAAAVVEGATTNANVDLPSFSDCLDYLIDVFGTNHLHKTSSAVRMRRHRP